LKKIVFIDSALLLFVICIVLIQPSFAAAGPVEQLTLENCLALANKNNRDLQAAAQSVTIARAAVKEAEGNFRPKLDYAVVANKAEDPIYPYPKVLFPYADTDFSSGSISITQPLFQGGRLTNQLRIARTQFNMMLENEQKSKEQLTFQVKEAFYQVWLAEQTVKVAQASYDNLEQHAQKTNDFYQAGKASKYENLRAQVQRDTLTPQVIAAQNNLKLVKLSLANLIGFSQSQPYSIITSAADLKIPAKQQPDLQQVLAAAYQDRPEMRQIKLSQDLSRLQLKLAEAGNKPSLALIGKYQGQSLSYSPGDWWDNRYWTCTLSINGNFYDGSVTASKIEGAQGNVELANIKEAKLRDQIRLEVEQAVQGYENSLATIRANQANIGLAKETLELTRVRFDAGMATIMDIIDSQLALDQATNGYYRGIADYLIAQARLELVTGRGKRKQANS
jgi:outer membrane protein